MSFAEYWQALSTRSKWGLSIGLIGIVAFVGCGIYWTMRPDYEVAIRSSSPERIAAAVREIERLKIPYRVSADGNAVEVPSGQLGRVRVGVSQGAGGAGNGVGFELFNNTDFSTTEFTQKINYQRALQGELARTISSIEGISSARVHLVLPESGFLRRQSAKPTAAVTVFTEGGAQLNAAQVQGIQKLVAASVPEIRLDDIAVIDQDGVALTRTHSGMDDSAPNGRLDMKRDVDAYLEGKIRKMLTHADPDGDFSISVDAALRQDDIRVTTEDVLPAADPTVGAKQTGVLVRERQTNRSEASANEPAGGASGPQSAATTREVEYKVGHRIEQVVTAPGGVERISIAVVGRVASNAIDAANLRDLVMHAVGASEERGDSVAVVLLPSGAHQSNKGPEQLLPSTAGRTSASVDGHTAPVSRVIAWVVGGLLALLLLIALVWRRTPPAAAAQTDLSEAELARIVGKIENWLQEARAHGTN